MTGESGQLTPAEAWHEAYTEENLHQLDQILAVEIQRWVDSVGRHNSSKGHVLAEAARLRDRSEALRGLIAGHRVEEPIDLEFVLDLAETLDSAQAYVDRHKEAPSPEAEAAEMAANLAGLVARNANAAAEAAELAYDENLFPAGQGDLLRDI